MTDVNADHGTSDVPAVVALQARVIRGRYADCVVAVELGQTITVGYEFASTVVLRTASVKGTRLRLTLMDDMAQLVVVDGTAEVLGHTLVAGGTMLLPNYTPVKIGDEQLAFGFAGAPEWERTLALARSPESPAMPNLALAPGQVPLLSRLLQQLPRRNPILARPVLVGGLALVLLAGIGLKDSASAYLAETDSRVPEARAALVALGAPGLNVVLQGDVLHVSGFVETPAQARRIAAQLARRGQQAKLQLTTGADMAQAVSDTLRVQGVSGPASYIGHRTVEITTAAVTAEKAAELEKNARRDVPGLRHVQFRARPTAAFTGFNGLALATANPGKRISSLVGGEAGYLVTADGGRYFIGAMLPTGHRIVAIDGAQVMLEQNGAAVRWIF